MRVPPQLSDLAERVRPLLAAAWRRAHGLEARPVVLIVSVVAALLVALGVRADRYFAQELRAEQAFLERATSKTSTNVAAFLEDAARHDVRGHLLFLNDVPLSPGPGKRLLRAGHPEGAQLLVLWDDLDPEKLGAGLAFDITGTLEPMPSLGVLRGSWKLDRKTAAAVRKEGIYLRAHSVVPQ